MELTHFKIKTKSGLFVQGEYEGNLESSKLIIFSHGFGVTRDSHGMFNELGNMLNEKYLILRFDYNIVNKEENWTQALSYTCQAEMLNAVYEYIKKQFRFTSIVVIAHSMGCLITGMAQLKGIEKTLLLAAPIVPPYIRMKKYFSRRPETIINEEGLSKIKRSDGSYTLIEKEFWEDMKKVNPVDLYTKISESSQTTFIRAKQDQVIDEENYDSIKNISKIKFIEIDGNHDFEGEARIELKKIIFKLFDY